MGDDNKHITILMVVVGLLALVAIIVSAVSLSKTQNPNIQVDYSGGKMGGGAAAPQAPPAQYIVTPNGGAAGGGMSIDAGGAAFPVGTLGRIYTLAIGHDYGSHEYFDDKGYLAGFGLGLVDLICQEAGIDCRMVWDRYDNCWDSKKGQHATGGQGIHDRWYDACTGWYTTVERIHVFQFASPYLKATQSHFYVLPGKSFNPTKAEIEKRKVLFLEGWASDHNCLYRVVQAQLEDNKAKYVVDTDAAMELLNNGWDALFTTETTVRERIQKSQLVKLNKDFGCMIAGNTIMARKDSDLPSHWNRGFNKVRTNGKFKKYCTEANDAHKDKGHVECVNSY